MQLYPILVVAVILAADGRQGLSPAAPPLGDAAAALVAIVPVVVTVVLATVAVRACDRRLARGRTPRPVVVADRILHAARWILLVNHAGAVLVGGWLLAVRDVVGDLILVDELIAMTPPLAGATALWWAHYPIERRLREAMLVRRLDLGQPVYDIPTRPGYVVQQLRLQMLLLLVPVVLILGLVESIRSTLDRIGGGDLPPWAADAATFAAGLGVFFFSPLLARAVLSVQPLAAGPVRDDLLEICRRHRVRVREILLWRTDGSMINAAVMGLVGPLRFVLLTDALIDTMSREQVQAVMAHEIGHIRRHHMPWLVASLVAVLLLATLVLGGLFVLLGWAGLGPEVLATPWLDGTASGLAAAAALLAFGWISRRYERQADTFAVQHLSGLAVGTDNGRSRHVTDQAVHAMHSALEAIARLNMVDPRRRSWRHGSIAWRQAYLASIVGRPLEALPIDRLIRRTKATAAALVVLGGAGLVALEWSGTGAAPGSPAVSADVGPPPEGEPGNGGGP